MIELRLPKIDAPTEQGKINQIQDYLFQTIRQINLNFADKDSNGQDERHTGDTYNYVVKKTTNIQNGTDEGEDEGEDEGAVSVTETGTWTPTVKVGAYARVDDATYTKVGKLVFVCLSGIYIPSPSTPSSDEFRIYGLPFPVVDRGFGEVTLTYLQFFTDATQSTPCTNVNVELLTSGDDSFIRFKGWSNGRNYHTLKYDEVKLSSSGEISISAVYQTE